MNNQPPEENVWLNEYSRKIQETIKAAQDHIAKAATQQKTFNDMFNNNNTLEPDLVESSTGEVSEDGANDRSFGEVQFAYRLTHGRRCVAHEYLDRM